MRFLLFVLLLSSSLSTYGQGDDTIKKTDFYEKIKNYDLSGLWYRDNITDDENNKFAHPEALGFIEDSFQRFYIHYTSIIKNPEDPYEYLVKGKTKVKNNICTFHGTITIVYVDSASIYHDDSLYLGNSGNRHELAVCKILFYEDKNHAKSGFIVGELKSYFCFDKHEVLRYDMFGFYVDYFTNNQVIGKWTSYASKVSKKCNWGDFRIPDCGDLDIGAGDFGPDPKYSKYGWENYQPEILKSSRAIKEQWWK